MYLIIVDAYSKWLNAELMREITAEKTIQKLRTVFSSHGIPKKIVTDNGPTFCSKQFTDFVNKNGIKHIFSALYQPSTNDLAERAVQTMKQALHQMQGPGSVEDKLSRFLFKYRITPHSTTGVAPCELLMGRQLRSRLDLLHPDFTMSRRVEKTQQNQMKAHDNQKPHCEFKKGDKVDARDFTSSVQKWVKGVIIDITGPFSHQVKLADVKSHVDSIKLRTVDDSNPNPDAQDDDSEGPISESTQDDGVLKQSELVSSSPSTIAIPTDKHSELSTGLRCSIRVRRPPTHFGQSGKDT